MKAKLLQIIIAANINENKKEIWVNPKNSYFVKMSERKFCKGVGKPGMAAQVRETVSQVVKDSVQVSQTKLVEPIDYENFVLKNKTLLQNDPQRELLLYPSDDVSQVVLPRRYRTIAHTLPSTAEINICNLFVKECLKSYSSNWNLVHYKYSAYSGSYLDLPKILKSEDLKDEVYEVDTEADQLDEDSFTKIDGISKEGFLLKGPDIGSDRIFVNIGSKSFKRRYCYLRQHVDGTYYLELHKDDKKGEAKTTIDMDFCNEIIKNSKKGRYCFELHMSGHKSFTFAAETEADLQDWVSKLNQVLQQNKAQEEKRSASLERSYNTSPPSPQPSQTYGTLKGLEESMNPQLIKYGRETDASIALARKENRKRLFIMYPDMPHSKSGYSSVTEPNSEPYREQFGQRILIRCESLKFKLQAPLEESGEGLCQIEPYFTSLALFDVRQNRKLTENFYFDINHPRARAMVSNQSSENVNIKKFLSSDLAQLPDEWIAHPRQAVFSISCPHPDIYLVLRIDKVLQGSIGSASEPYIRSTKDPRLGSRILKSVKASCQRLGKYHMPFAWAAKPLFRPYSNELDTSADFPAIYRQEPNRLKDEEILKILAEYKKPDKLNKLTVIPGCIKIKVEGITELPENSITSSLVPLKPFPIPPANEPTFEITEFEGTTDVHPYTTFNNHLYVYPHSLNFDTQKTFTRARNIACCIELRDSDSENAEPLYCMYGRPGSPLLGKRITTTVLHHNTNPVWYEEVKLKLPIHLKPDHHLLFTFYHISCELNKKKENNVESCVGYAWVPLLHKGRLLAEEQSLAVASHLPPGYLSIQPLGLGKGNAGPDITWIDGQRQIFTVGFQLVSTVITKDLHLHNLFCHMEKLMDKQSPVVPSDTETCKILKASHAIHLATAITFLPTILNQLFNMLLLSSTEDVGLNVIRILIHVIHLIQEAGRRDILLPYVKFVFVSPSLSNIKTTVHEELSRYLPVILSPANTDFLVVNKFMYHSNFFFQIMVKSMVQYLLSTGRIKMHRHERFSTDYLQRIEELLKVLVPYIISKHREMSVETQELNKSIALFLKKCLTVMDRGYVFKLINYYMEIFKGTDSRVLQEYKFIFLQIICSHEHYIAFNLPVLNFKIRPNKSGDSPVNDFNLSEEFRKYHYLVGLLLYEVKCSLNQVVQIRKCAISTLRDLLAKHELDDRYQSKGQLSRIASLYVPLLSIVIDNLYRMYIPQNENLHPTLDTRHSRMSSSSSLLQSNSICSTTTKSFQRFNVEPSSRASVNLKDSHLFAVIAGQSGMMNGTSSMSLESDDSGDGHSTVSQETTIVRDMRDTDSDFKTHSRSFSGATTISQTGRDKFQVSEVKDILMCFLFVVKYLGEESLISWWQQSEDNVVFYFFSVIEICLQQFKYLGRKQIVGKPISGKPTKAMTLPARMQPPDFSKTDGTNLPMPSGTNSVGRDGQLALDSDSSKVYQALLEANMATEVGLIALDTLGLYCVHFKENLLAAQGDNLIMKKIFDIYLFFLQVGQSETLFRHVFAALRAFINNFSDALFEGTAVLCGRLCYELLRCCNSKLSSIRQESCVILYLLMRSNFEFTKRKGLTRVHLQVIISVSQMLGNIVGLNNSRFQESLSLINNYAKSDKVMKGTGLKSEVKDLTKRIRTVLMATAQMREHQQDPEMLVDLQHSLACSYASTPELRLTWLQTMTRNHLKEGNFSEATCCQLHIAAMIAEYLKLKKVQVWGAEAFADLSTNIPQDEKGLKLDAGVQDVQYTEQMLLEQLENCVPLIENAERYELLGPLYRLIIPMYERRRNYHALSQCYKNLASAYAKVAEVNKTGKRLLGRYYRVAFFGSAYFDEKNAENESNIKSGVEYIYKEPKVTSLSEVSEKLYKLHCEKFGHDIVKIIMDSNPINISQLDPKMVYLQVTSVTPYFDNLELEKRQTEFETSHDINNFMFETPFTKDGRIRASPEDQWKRRTILKTKHSFPYVTKRIEITDRKVEEHSPIEVALDEMRLRVSELEEVVYSCPTDVKKLQLRLQGSVCVQVNAGPLAYANAFLDSSRVGNYPEVKVEELKDVFHDFAKICHSALQINRKVIESDQIEYQEVLQSNFQKMCQDLSIIFGESLCPENDTLDNFKKGNQSQFTVISGSSHSSSTA